MLNFKKAGIFSRGSGQEDACEQKDQSGGVLAVWGSPGSGKTTVAVRLAKYLADKRRNVILLLCDMTAPMLPCICPAADLECERSLGSVLAAAHVSENLVKNNLVTHKRLGYLTMLGMLKGENEYTYPPYNEVQARELIDCLREIAPYVVIDCGSYIANDILSAVALMEADSVLRLANADLKSVQPTSPPAGCQMGYGQAVQDRQQCKVPAGRGSHESGAGDSGLHAAPFGGAGGTVSGRQPAGGPIHEGQPGIPQGDREDCQGGVWVLGEKRSQSLFAPKASAEKAAATHITTGPDGRKKELPLYFGPDCPVSGNMGQNQHEAGVGEPQPADEPLRHAPADDGTGVEADPTDSVNMAEDLPRRSLNTESAGGYRAHSLFFTPENEGQDFNTVLQDVQEYISGKYSALITEGGDEDAKAQIKRYITKYVQDRRIAVKGYSGDQLVDALYTEMAEFGLLTKYIFGTGIEEINVNSWRDIEVLYANGETVKLEEHFDSPEHAVNVIRRMLHVSGMVLDNASPAVLGHLSKNIRIAVLKTPLVDEDVGVTASIRIVNPQNMQKEDFVKGGTATGPMLDFLAACLRYGVSVCVAGATGSGKTTVAGWLLTTIPDNKRIFTIENGSRELDLVREKDGRVCNSVIHTITRESENAKQNIDQDMLLDMALRYHPDIICVGEMRSAEAYAAQEAARTGHGVLTTIHSNSSQATWRRMVTLCKRKHEMADDTLMDLVTEAFPIVVFAKQLEDKSRKIMEIMECEILPTGERRYNTLYHFKIEENRLEDGKYRIKGRHEAVNPISESLQKRFIDNGMPQEVLTQLVGKKSAPSKGKSGSSPAKAGQATPAPKTRSAQSKPPAKPETGKEGGESV